VVHYGLCLWPRSDEELEDYKALLYLPIAPEVEDPEENPFGPPPDASVQTAAPEEAALAAGDKKQRQPSSEGGSTKKKARTTTIELQGVPSDGESATLKTPERRSEMPRGPIYVGPLRWSESLWVSRTKSPFGLLQNKMC